MAHRSNITSATRNVGWFDQNWRYDYTVTWLAGNASIREVKIDKTKGAAVTAPLRFKFGFPPWIRDPRIDIGAPTGWVLISRPTQFEFMIQPPPLGPLANFIPPLIGPPPFVPAPPPFAGKFRIYSVENPTTFPAFTTDHLNGRFPAVPGGILVQAPNRKEECAKISAYCEKEKGGYSYTYVLSSEYGAIWQGILFIQPEVEIESIKVSEQTWSTYRVGFGKPTDKNRADGSPTDEEKGILYFGTWECPVERDCGLRVVSVSFFSKAPPGYILVLANKFNQQVIGPVAEKPRGNTYVRL